MILNLDTEALQFFIFLIAIEALPRCRAVVVREAKKIVACPSALCLLVMTVTSSPIIHLSSPESPPPLPPLIGPFLGGTRSKYFYSRQLLWNWTARKRERGGGQGGTGRWEGLGGRGDRGTQRKVKCQLKREKEEISARVFKHIVLISWKYSNCNLQVQKTYDKLCGDTVESGLSVSLMPQIQKYLL